MTHKIINILTFLNKLIVRQTGLGSDFGNSRLAKEVLQEVPGQLEGWMARKGHSTIFRGIILYIKL